MSSHPPYLPNLLTLNAIGIPTQTIWIATPIAVIFHENGRLATRDIGTTTSCIKKYTAMPYSAPATTAYSTKNPSHRLAT